ncbi:hypothetical protein [Frondihabitans australicus]|uniref:DUF4365 domain-containing protein n=1 Tax=Frondihabitans australicus TaxID=386892 RepID=A0A495IFM8_9MICO|nr:hypothetical protein [Frondihabitans australicus]RKR74744.1 hypothetical protein C8E83_1873 [Frondihabitans australicus]
MVDTKQTKTIGEHAVASERARRGWAPALTRDGLERTDILAVELAGRRTMIEVQVKAARGRGPRLSWPLGEKSQQPALHPREWFVMVAIDDDVDAPLRFFVVPRDHVAAAAWIEHMNWLTTPGIAPGVRNVGPERSRVTLPTFAGYENAWSLLTKPTDEVPVALPPEFHTYAEDTERVGLPGGHPWREALPSW